MSKMFFAKTLNILEKEAKIFYKKVLKNKTALAEAEDNFFATIRVMSEINNRYAQGDTASLQKLAEASKEYSLGNAWYFSLKMLADGVDADVIEEILWSKAVLVNCAMTSDCVAIIDAMIRYRAFALIPKKLSKEVFEEALRSLLPGPVVASDFLVSKADYGVSVNKYYEEETWKDALIHLAESTAKYWGLTNLSTWPEKKKKAKEILDSIPLSSHI